MGSNLYYYDREGIQVSSRELRVRGSRYFLADVNAVFVTRQLNYRRYPIFIGLCMFFITVICGGGTASLVFGIITVLCFIIAICMRTKYVLRLRNRFGETRPLISTNRQELEEIRQAIYKAMEENEVII